MISYDRFVAAFHEMFWESEEAGLDWRQGQIYFNVLCGANRGLAEELRGSVLDPFHDERVSQDTWEFVKNNW